MARRSDARNGLKTNERGYGLEHKKLRAKLERLVAAGEAVCWRCGLPIHPGERWDLGHDDADRAIYRGAEHARCNRASASRRNGMKHAGQRLNMDKNGIFEDPAGTFWRVEDPSDPYSRPARVSRRW